MAKLSKDQLKAKMQANSPTTNRTVTAIPLTDLTGAKPNGANAKANLNVPKLKGVKEGVTRTQRYSFEITPDRKQDIEQYIINYRKKTGKNISKSEVIRKAIEKYVKGKRL